MGTTHSLKPGENMDITLEVLLTVFSSLFATGLIGVGVYWATSSAWPWFAERDAQERERRFTLAQSSTTTQEAMALALASVAESLANPIRVSIIEKE